MLSLMIFFHLTSTLPSVQTHQANVLLPILGILPNFPDFLPPQVPIRLRTIWPSEPRALGWPTSRLNTFHPTASLTYGLIAPSLIGKARRENYGSKGLTGSSWRVMPRSELLWPASAAIPT